MRIFCIGDSHVSLFSGVNKVQAVGSKKIKNLLPFFRIFPLGPLLAYNLTKEKLVKALQKVSFKDSYILLAFGEIDCRAHLIKQSRIQKRTIDKIVSECIDRYFSVILKVKKLGFKPLIYNAIPSTRLNNINSKDYPTVGNCRERNIVTSMFNEGLESKCKSNKIHFISTYNYFVDKDGLTNMDYYMDTVHLSQKAMQVTLKVISKELEVDLKLLPYQFMTYKLSNIFLDSLNVTKKIKVMFLKINSKHRSGN